MHILGRSRHSKCRDLRRGRRQRAASPWPRSSCCRAARGSAAARARSRRRPSCTRRARSCSRRAAYDQARESFARLAERHPESDLVPVAAFLVGEAYYRAEEYDKAAKEFDHFVTLYPSHAIADLGQYRLARTYFDQMPIVERDQGVTLRGAGRVPAAHPSVPGEPLRARCDRQDRSLSSAARREGAVGGGLLRAAQQPAGRPPALRRRPQGFLADRRRCPRPSIGRPTS